MDPEIKKQLLEVVDRKEFIDILEKAFPGKREVTVADLGEDVFRHLMKNVFRETVRDHTDPREAFLPENQFKD